MPSNDNQANAIILDSEFGSIAGSTVGSTGETSPTGTNGTNGTGKATVTNGHDVWYAWRAGWIRSFTTYNANINVTIPQAGALRYMVWTTNANFQHVLRVYTVVGGQFHVVATNGKPAPGFGKNQRLEFIQNVSEFNDPPNEFIFVQVDAASKANAQEGTFTLNWGRSKVPSIGDIDGYAAFVDIKGYKAVFKGRATVTDVSGVKQFWFGDGASYPKGLYRAQYCGGYYGLVAADGPLPIKDSRVDILYNDGIAAFASIDTGAAISNLMQGLGYYDPVATRLYSRFLVYSFQHAGGKIGIQFQDFYGASQGGFWLGPSSLPYWTSAILDQVDYGYADNYTGNPSSRWGLWRMVEIPDFEAAGFVDDTYYSGGFGIFSVLNNTQATYFNVTILPPYGNPTNQTSVATWLPGQTIPLILSFDATNIPLIFKLYFALDGAQFGPLTWDLTPQLVIQSAKFNGVVTRPGGVRKWSVSFTVANQNWNRRVGSPQLVLLPINAQQIEYPSGQGLGNGLHGTYYSGVITAYFVPPPGQPSLTLSLVVQDGTWTSPVMMASITGQAL